jgi:hypothetical protein
MLDNRRRECELYWVRFDRQSLVRLMSDQLTGHLFKFQNALPNIRRLWNCGEGSTV